MKSAEDPDILIFLGCTFTRQKEKELEELVAARLNEFSSSILIVSGCYLQQSLSSDRVFYIRSGEVVDFIRKRFDANKAFGEDHVKETNGVINIAEGCLSNCSYCSIKNVRGNLVSRPVAKIIADTETALNQGHVIIKLTGQEVCAYGKDINSSLPKLLNEIWARFPEVKIEYGSMNPKWLKSYSINELGIFADERVQGNIHIPLQSASDRILEMMRRGYTFAEYCALYERFVASGVTKISTDVISGFPSETKKEHEFTLEAVSRFRYTFMQIFAYDERPGTDAKSYEGSIPRPVRIERALDVLAQYVVSYGRNFGISEEDIISGNSEIPFNTNFRLSREYIQ